MTTDRTGLFLGLAFCWPSVPGLTTGEPVVVYDNQRIPHIFSLDTSASAEDRDRAVFYGLGYTQMRDFPVQTMDNIFSAAGRYAELWGSYGKVQDRGMLRWEIPALAEAHYDGWSLDDPFGCKPLIDAYVAGIEDARQWWLDHEDARDDVVGPNGELFADPLPKLLENHALLGHAEEAFLHMLECSVRSEDVVALGFALSAAFFHTDGLSPASAGSNAWVLRTDGDLVTMTDSHLPFDEGGLSPYFVQMYGGAYRVSGWTIAGYPCVMTGFNEHLSWTTTVGGSFQVPGVAASKGNTPVVRGVWDVQLHPTLLRFPFGNPPGLTELVALQSQTRTIKTWVGPEGTCSSTCGAECEEYECSQETFWFVPADGTSDTPRYPLLVESLSAPLPTPVAGNEIEFEQHSFTSGVPAWEFMIGLGKAASAAEVRDEVVPNGVYAFGRALNLFVADDGGAFYYTLLATVPEPGPNTGTPWVNQPSYTLDGSDPGQRWVGTEPASELPHVYNDETSDAVWILNNGTPHSLGEAFTPSTPLSHVLEATPAKSLRSKHAEDLLLAITSPTQEDSEAVALDVGDPWMVALWPLFEKTQELRLSGASADPNVDDLVDWLNDSGTPGGALDGFAATVNALGTVYTTLLRAEYEARIGALAEESHHIRLGFDATFAPPEPEEFDEEDWAPNLTAMEESLVAVGALFDAGQGANGLATRDLFAALNSVVTTSMSPPPVTPQPWTALLASGGVRWGLVNSLVLTPHFLGLHPASLLGSSFWAFFFSGFLTPAFEPIVSGNNGAVHQEQRVAVYPMPGVRDSLFNSNGVAPAQEALYPFDPFEVGGRSLYLQTHSTLGSVVPLSVLIPEGEPPRGRYLAALGTTGITTAVPDLSLGADDRWATVPAFVAGDWLDFETDYAVLSQSSQHTLVLELEVPDP